MYHCEVISARTGMDLRPYRHRGKRDVEVCNAVQQFRLDRGMEPCTCKASEDMGDFAPVSSISIEIRELIQSGATPPT